MHIYEDYDKWRHAHCTLKLPQNLYQKSLKTLKIML